MKKNVFKAVVCLVMALSLIMLTACSGGESASDTQNAGNGTQTGTPETASADALYTGYGSDYIVSHEEGKTVTYTLEAEYTNLGNKFGTAFSGERSETNMVVEGDSTASNGYAVAGLCKKGLSVNFVIVSDRDVENATLILRIGNEQAPDIPFTISADTYSIRVDPVSEIDTYPYDAEESGAWGNWDADFLAVYAEDGYLPFAGYYVTEWDCGEIEFAATNSTASGFDDSVITTHLKLQKGLNCISLITNNDDIPDAGGILQPRVFLYAPFRFLQSEAICVSTLRITARFCLKLAKVYSLLIPLSGRSSAGFQGSAGRSSQHHSRWPRR